MSKILHVYNNLRFNTFNLPDLNGEYEYQGISIYNDRIIRPYGGYVASEDNSGWFHIFSGFKSNVIRHETPNLPIFEIIIAQMPTLLLIGIYFKKKKSLV